jgi:hypothetical protein
MYEAFRLARLELENEPRARYSEVA